MLDETPSGSRETTPSAGSAGECGAEQSPLQCRAAFLENWDWQFIVSLNQRACQRGRAQHGVNSETCEACQEEWQETHLQELTPVRQASSATAHFIAGVFDEQSLHSLIEESMRQPDQL